jgi:hypothetical protein
MRQFRGYARDTPDSTPHNSEERLTIILITFNTLLQMDGNPLVDWAMGTLNLELNASSASNEVFDSARTLITQFLDREISYPSAQANMKVLMGSSSCIDKLFEIISLPDEPIPSEGSHGPPLRVALNRHRTHPWTPHEDYRLLGGIYRFGIAMWPAVAQFVGNGRTRSQCSQRWIRGLDPRISKEPWTKAEEEQLLKLVDKYGSRSWVKVAAEMGKRADVQCRYHFHQMARGSASKGECGKIESPPNLMTIPLSDVGKCVSHPHPRMPAALAMKYEEFVDAFAGPIIWDDGTAITKADTLFSSDFWAF